MLTVTGVMAACQQVRRRGLVRGRFRRLLDVSSSGYKFNIKMARRYHYHVYVIELSKDVLYETKFKKANPDYVPGKPCVYVGMTGLNPDVRFDKHKAGIQSNRYAREFGLRLLPELYEMYNPMPYQGAREMEVELAIGLRESGYAVWQA